jgi:hypothetical protein
VASVLLFVLTSWLCGLAHNMTTLIAFRALQGLVAGPMIPLSQTLLLASYPRALAGWRWPCGRSPRWWRPSPGRCWAAGSPTTFQLAVDLLHQRAGRPAGGGGHLGDLPRARIAHAPAADRRGGAGAAGAVGRRAAADAGQGQGAGLVPLAADRGVRRGGGGGPGLLSGLGADRRAPGGRPVVVCAAQFLVGRAGHGGRLRRVHRQRGHAAAVAAAVHGLHGHPGGHDPGAGGPAGHGAGAAGGQERSTGSIRACTSPAPSWCSRWCCGCARASPR